MLILGLIIMNYMSFIQNWLDLIFPHTQEQKAAPEYGQGINPISRLIQIQQAKKEKEPVYTLLAERGVPRRREFIMQVRRYCLKPC